MSQNSRPRILSIANQKGGVGKTTTTINLAASLAEVGLRTLIIDIDPQGNASTGLGIDRSIRTVSSYDLLIDGSLPAQAILETQVRGVNIVAANADLSSIDIELGSASNRVARLKSALKGHAVDDFHYILIDCPPSLNLLTLNALTASDAVLIPLQCEFFALEGISQLLHTVSMVRNGPNPALTTQGIVLTMYDSRNNLTSDVEDDVRATLGPLVFDTVIPRNVRLSEAPSHGLPVTIYDPRSSGSLAYRQLAAELIKRRAKNPTTKVNHGT